MNDSAAPSVQNIAGVILAAGGSSRMGQSKLLLPWKGEALIRWPVKAALQAGLSPVIVVTGAYAEAIEQTLAGLDVVIVHNPDWAEGQSTSLRSGMAALPNDIEAAVLLLGDQPQLLVDLIQDLVREYRENAPAVPIYISAYQEKRGNPVLFDRSVFQELQSLSGDAGGRQIFSKHPLMYVPVNNPDQLFDIDSPADYRHLTEKSEGDEFTNE